MHDTTEKKTFGRHLTKIISEDEDEIGPRVSLDRNRGYSQQKSDSRRAGRHRCTVIAADAAVPFYTRR